MLDKLVELLYNCEMFTKPNRRYYMTRKYSIWPTTKKGQLFDVWI